jgi:glycosyltransferase involved in cell wall biosynthesis
MTLLWNATLISLAGKMSPVVYHAHTYPPVRPNLKHCLTKFLLKRKAEAIIGVSRSVTAAFRDYLGRGKIYRTIYNGIELSDQPPFDKAVWPDFMNGITPGRPLIGMASRFAPNKGIKEFMDTIPALSKRLPTARFVLAGDGPLLPWARHYSQTIGWSDRISFPGFIQDVSRFWASLDLALFTSPKESFGLGIIEPQAAGVMVAGYANGSGSDEIIINGKTGVMANWADREALARKIEVLWTDPPRYRQMARDARRRLETCFSIKKMTKECLTLYESLLTAGA